ncbi:sporulation protein [Desulfosediminicola sp.]|uniref:sporulation protein n=1 Tax=Desulfosediminicola sp. TaxID=2886825 RepID=UPI003AF22227
MFKKLFARLGVGSASVDAVLTTEYFEPGGLVEGRVEIKAGEVEQEVAAITIKLMTIAERESDDESEELNHTIASHKVADALLLKPGENREVPFSFPLHMETPVTVLDVGKNHCKVWLETALDIELALDPTDRDYLNVHPTPVMQHLITAMIDKGFKMVKADVEEGFLNGGSYTSESGCYQEIEFKPKAFFSGVREVEISFVPQADCTHVLIELNRTFAGDGYRSLTLANSADLAEVKESLASLM